MALYNSRSQFDSQGYKVGFEQVLKLLLKTLDFKACTPLVQLGGRIKNFRKFFVGGIRNFYFVLFWWVGGGVILLGRSRKSHNLNVKIEIA